MQYPVGRRGGPDGAGTLEAQVRAGTEADLSVLTDHCDHYARETAITCDASVLPPEQRRPWWRSHP
ncbi:hypothetical protein [Streptomyces sp. A5-4]|uniref:hypothetical protein n=1 Tax=Streptomyces sp. A5-4 TaxID=3384771 RepID=UPI003DA953BD